MKYSMLIFIAVMITSCVEDSWSSDEQKTFSMQCQAEGGSKKYCNCFLRIQWRSFHGMKNHWISSLKRQWNYQKIVNNEKIGAHSFDCIVGL